MDAVKFVKEHIRMCKKYGLKDGCKGCPLNGEYCNIANEKTNIEFVVSVVEKWSKENPQKTMLEDFSEKFPKYKKTAEGVPIGCPDDYGYEEKSFCDSAYDSCFNCWNRPIE